MAMKIIRVLWEDITEKCGWTYPGESISTCKVQTVGLLVGNTKKYIALAMSHIEDNGGIGAVLIIPKGNILKIEQATEKGWKKVRV